MTYPQLKKAFTDIVSPDDWDMEEKKFESLSPTSDEALSVMQKWFIDYYDDQAIGTEGSMDMLWLEMATYFQFSTRIVEERGLED